VWGGVPPRGEGRGGAGSAERTRRLPAAALGASGVPAGARRLAGAALCGPPGGVRPRDERVEQGHLSCVEVLRDVEVVRQKGPVKRRLLWLASL